jgi:UDP:flavonoid glycosyltransferase YjiC (YdhE family)
MSVDVGIIHYCEGGGHAMRMLAIAEELEKEGVSTEIIGGGPGEKFVKLNREVKFSPKEVDVYQEFTESGVISALSKIPRNVFKRLSDLRKWIREEDPEIVLADGPVGYIAAFLEGKKLYAFQHLNWRVPDSNLEKIVTYLSSRLIHLKAQKIFFPVIGDKKTPSWAEKIGPVAPDWGGRKEDLDVLVVPTKISEDAGFEGFAEELSDYKVKVVGSDNWETEPSLQPYIRGADVVISGGHTTLMEASVAGTSCIMVPYSSEQKGIANLLDKTKGFRKYSGDIVKDVESVEEPKPRQNGAEEAAVQIKEDLIKLDKD